MALSKQKFELIKRDMGGHTSWAVWAEEGKKPKSNVGDLSIFTSEDKLKYTLEKLNPNVVLAGLNGSNGNNKVDLDVTPFANFHSNWHWAQDFKIRYATVNTPLQGAFMTDVIKHHFETDSTLVLKELKKNPDYEREKVNEFFKEIRTLSNSPLIFAFGGLAFDLINKYNVYGFQVYKLYHYAFTMSKEKFREHTLQTLKTAGII